MLTEPLSTLDPRVSREVLDAAFGNDPDYNPYPHIFHDDVADVARVQSYARKLGAEVSIAEAYHLWGEYSGYMFATWLIADDSHLDRYLARALNWYCLGYDALDEDAFPRELR